jgi:hypothetical protein
MARVVLVAMTGMLRDIVRGAIDEADDMTLVGDVGDLMTLEHVLGPADPDVVVWRVERAGLPEGCDEVMATHPGIRVLTVRAKDGRGSVWELRPRQRHVGELSPDLLAATIRGSTPS